MRVASEGVGGTPYDATGARASTAKAGGDATEGASGFVALLALLQGGGLAATSGALVIDGAPALDEVDGDAVEDVAGDAALVASAEAEAIAGVLVTLSAAAGAAAATPEAAAAAGSAAPGAGGAAPAASAVSPASTASAASAADGGASATLALMKEGEPAAAEAIVPQSAGDVPVRARQEASPASAPAAAQKPGADAVATQAQPAPEHGEVAARQRSGDALRDAASGQQNEQAARGAQHAASTHGTAAPARDALQAADARVVGRDDPGDAQRDRGEAGGQGGPGSDGGKDAPRATSPFPALKDALAPGRLAQEPPGTLPPRSIDTTASTTDALTPPRDVTGRQSASHGTPAQRASLAGAAAASLPSWVERLASPDGLVASRRSGTLRFELEPNGLGRIEVRLSFGRDGVRAQVFAEHDHTRALIANQQPQLAAAFERNDIRLESFLVDLGLGAGGGGDARRDAADVEALDDLGLVSSSRPDTDEGETIASSSGLVNVRA